jgi:tetratricopeptide (TPR) repeat protein
MLAVTAAGMMLYGLQYLGASWAFAQARPDYMLVTKGQLPGELELDALTRSLRSSPYRSDQSGAAFVQLLRAQQLGIKSVRALPRLIAARHDLRLGIAASPADAYAWTRLAVAEAQLDDRKQAADALAMALELAPAERVLASMQFDMAVLLWDNLGPSAKASLAQRLKWIEGIPELHDVAAGNSARALRDRLKADATR